MKQRYQWSVRVVDLETGTIMEKMGEAPDGEGVQDALKEASIEWDGSATGVLNDQANQKEKRNA